MIFEDEQATARAAAGLAGLVRPGDVVALSGSLGSGKTSFARSLIRALGHQGEVPSPSFPIVQPYEELDPPLWHADLYRIDDPSELDELGLDQLDHAVLVVEWPERAGRSAWPQALRLTLEITGPESRALTSQVPPAWEGRWPPR